MSRTHKILMIAIAILALAASAWIALNIDQRATAGIGPAGFATYAKQGIVSKNCKIYGGCRNSPWIVTCAEKPSYITMSDLITCKVRGK